MRPSPPPIKYSTSPTPGTLPGCCEISGSASASLSVNPSPVLRDQKSSDNILPGKRKPKLKKKKYRSEQNSQILLLYFIDLESDKSVSVINVVSFCFCKELVASVKFEGCG
jgi:hypothetical protein